MSEKNQKPTQRRLRESRRKGDILKSAEVTTTTGYFVLITAMVTMLPWMYKRLERLFDLVWTPMVMGGNMESLSNVLAAIALEWFRLAAPVALIVACGAAVAGFAQARGVFSAEPVLPKFEMINPVNGLQRMFSTQNLFLLVKLLLKLFLMGAAIVWVIASAADDIMHLMYTVPVEGVHVAARLLLRLFVAIGALYVAHAAIDYGHQYWEYMKKMRMSRDEIQRENKDTDGNPQIKSERRRLARELLFSAPGEGTRNASVLVVNPTHFAVALFYEQGLTDLPVVLEKAVDDQALYLRGVAREAGVPVFEYPLLARQLFATARVSGYVPRDLFPAVAEVLTWVRRMKPAHLPR